MDALIKNAINFKRLGEVLFSTIFCAFLAASAWMCATFLLVVHADGLTFDIDLIARHILSRYVPLLIGVLIVIDIWLDTYVIRNRDGFFWKFSRFSWGLVVAFGIVTFFVGIGANFLADTLPGLMKTATLFALFLLFLIRMLSYIKVKTVRSLGVPIKVAADGKGQTKW